MKNTKKAEYGRLKKQIEKEYREKLKALALLYPEFAAPSGRITSSTRKKIGLAKLVRQVINHMDGEFTIHDVREKIIETYPTQADNIKITSISGVLIRLAKKGKLDVAYEGGGSSPKTYRRK